MKKIIIIPILILISFFFIVSNPQITVFGEETTFTFGGTGTQEDPYSLTTEDHLIEISSASKAGNDFIDKYFRLDSDIKMTKPFTPIGDGTTPFCGTFLGNNHTITNLEITAASPYVGLFGHLGATESGLSTVSNLRLDYPVINIQSGFENMTENVSIGLLVGYQGNKTNIIQCFVENAQIIINSANTSDTAPVEIYVGGLVGRSTGTIYSSTSHATIEVDYSYTGSWRPSDATYSFRTMVGGLIGYIDYIDTAVGINNSSVNTSKLTLSTGFDDESVTCEAFMGGLVGYSTESTLVNNCVFITDESAENETFWIAKSTNTPLSGTPQGIIGVILGYSERVASALYNYGCWMKDINITESEKIKPSDENLLCGYDLVVANGFTSDLTEGCIAYTSFLGTGYIVAAPGPTGAVSDPLIDNLSLYVSGKPAELWSGWEENSYDGLSYLMYTWSNEHTYEMSLDGNTINYACTTCADAHIAIIVIPNEIIYYGGEMTPVKFSYEGPWAEGVELTVTYQNNINPGIATAFITDNVNTVEYNFTILCSGHTSDGNYYHDDNEHWYQCTLCNERYEVKEHSYAFGDVNDLENISISCTTCLTEWKVEIILLDNVSLVYSGNPIEPYTARYDSLPDTFTVTTVYENNIDCGTAAVSIALRNSSSQEASTRIENFTILQKGIEQEWFSITSPVQYTGLSVYPEMTLSSEMDLQLDRDYRLEYINNRDIGTATVTITGINNYSGEVQLEYEIACIEHEYYYNLDKNNHWYECSLCYETLDAAPHNLTITHHEDTVIANCEVCGGGWVAEVRFSEEVDLECDGTEKKPYTLFYEEYPEVIPIKVTYKNNIYGGEATAEFEIGDITITKKYTITHTTHQFANEYSSDDVYHYYQCAFCDEVSNKGLHEGEEECTICGHSMDNYESKKYIEDQKETIDKIQSGTTDDPELNDAIKNVSPETIQEIADRLREELDKISELIDSNEIGKDEANIRVSIVEESTKAAVIISSAKIDEVEKLSERDEDSPIKLQQPVEEFFQKQFEELLNFDFENENTTLQAYQDAVTFTNTVVKNMRKAVGTIHECDGEEAHTEVNTFIEKMSATTFKNFDKEAADREFVMLAYQAILRHLQQQTLEMLEQSYQDAIENNRYQGTSRNEIEKIYLDNKEQITNIDIFEGIVLAVLQEKYIALINNKYEAGIYNDGEKEQLLLDANDSEKFKEIYFEIFKSWALNEQDEEISLEELTSTVVNDYGKDTIKIEVNDNLTSPEIICLFTIAGSFGAINIAYFILKSKGGIL